MSQSADIRTAPQIVADAPDRMEAMMRYVGNVMESDGFGVNRHCLDVPEDDPSSDYALIVADAAGRTYYLEVTEQ